MSTARVATCLWKVRLRFASSVSSLSEQRADAAERSDTRSDGLDSDTSRWEAETELWESTLPALP